LLRWRSGDPTLFAICESVFKLSNLWRRLAVVGLCATLSLHAVSLSAQDEAGWESELTGQRLRVCIWPDYRGVSFRDPRSGVLSGIDIDMAYALAADIGRTVEFVDSSFAQLIDDLQQSRCDVAMFAVGVTPERHQRLDFSAPYLASDVFAIALRSQARVRRWADIDQPQSVVAVARGTWHETWVPRVMTKARMLVLDTPAAREQEVRSGRADVFLTDYPFGVHLVREAGWAQLIAPPVPTQVTPYAYATRPGLSHWTARVDRFVADIKKDGRLRSAALVHGLEAIVQP